MSCSERIGGHVSTSSTGWCFVQTELVEMCQHLRLSCVLFRQSWQMCVGI